MGGIKRYEYTQHTRGMEIYHTMDEDPDGDYVLYTDHLAALRSSEERVRELEGQLVGCDEEERSCSKILSLKADNATLRNELAQREVEAINWAKIAGKNQAQINKLAVELEAMRAGKEVVSK